MNKDILSCQSANCIISTNKLTEGIMKKDTAILSNNYKVHNIFNLLLKWIALFMTLFCKIWGNKEGSEDEL
jgi:hypothetical protein